MDTKRLLLTVGGIVVAGSLFAQNPTLINTSTGLMLNPPGQRVGRVTIQVDPSSSFWSTFAPTNTAARVSTLEGRTNTWNAKAETSITNGLGGGASTVPVAVGSLGGSNTLNFATGAYQSALVTNALVLMPPTNGTHGARLEVWLKADGGGQTLNFGSAIVRPSDSASTYPKTLGTNLTYIVLLRNSSNIWWLTSLVGGY